MSNPLNSEYGYDQEILPSNLIKTSHLRARAIAKRYGITPQDTLTCSEKFWNMHLDAVGVEDYSAWALLTIQLNLSAGLVAYFAVQTGSRFLESLAEQIVNFDISAQFLMTEVGHGLDALNLETTVTVQPDGSFDLHTPHRGAEKFMPPTLPDVGVPRIGVVMARLIANGKDQGVHAFLVSLNDGVRMLDGITARALPERCGAPPLGHSLTSFNHVKLSNNALLGPLEPPLHPRIHFLSEIWRIGIGSATLTAMALSILQAGCYIVATYSKRRLVNSPPVPILSFRTQYRPILHGLARSFVLGSFYKHLRTAGGFDTAWENRDNVDHMQLRNAHSTIFKVTTINLSKEITSELVERCGAQGLLACNQIITGETVMNSHTLQLKSVPDVDPYTGLAFELLIGRYSIPPAQNLDHPLALHETDVFSELQTQLVSIMGSSGSSVHRSERSNALILPRANSLVEAIGARMAYEAALADPTIDPKMLKLYAIGCMQRDLAWYVESGVTSRAKVFEEEANTMDELLPRLDELLERTGVEPYIYAKICKEELWGQFADELPVFKAGTKSKL
ncbi:hypothetical protein V5O48_013699 [Marasmius crinis-equi]|uniref:Acyl-CoA oxidase n=1 Tax=Marasmius crinis-equi TaxID=585013 RepID=A0ABR3EZD2_9AGAR